MQSCGEAIVGESPDGRAGQRSRKPLFVVDLMEIEKWILK